MSVNLQFGVLVIDSLAHDIVWGIKRAVAVWYVEAKAGQWDVRGIGTRVGEGERSDTECEAVGRALVVVSVPVEES